MVDLLGFPLMFLMAQAMIQLIFVGIMIRVLFDIKKWDRSVVSWLWWVLVFWLFFIGVSEYGLIKGGLSIIVSWMAIFSAGVALIMFAIIIIKKFRLVNRIFAFPAVIVATGIFVAALIDRHAYSSNVILPMILSVFFVSIFWSLVFIDILIKTSKGYKLKVKKKVALPWKTTSIGLGISIVAIGLLFGGIYYSEKYVASELSGELNIYNWEDYLGEGVIEGFEKEFGVKVSLKTFKDDDVLLVEDLSGYDLSVANDITIERLIDLDRLAKVDTSNIPNLKYIDEKCIREDVQAYSVPYFWGTTGMAVNTKYISEDFDSWGVLWNLEYSGKLAVLNDPTEVTAMAAKYIGLPLVPQTSLQFKKVENFLLIQKPLLVGYIDVENLERLLISEEIWAAHVYGGRARHAILKNENIKYIVPKEGGVLWIDNFVIPKNAPNKYTAEVFLNYVLRPDVGAALADYQIYNSCNNEAMKLVNNSLLEPFDESSLKFLEYLSDYNESEEIIKMRKDLWNRLTEEEK